MPGKVLNDLPLRSREQRGKEGSSPLPRVSRLSICSVLPFALDACFPKCIHGLANLYCLANIS